MTDANYRGTLSAYAKWAKISLNAAIKRNKRGRIKFCDDFPHLVDFLATERLQRSRGRPQTRPRIYIKIHDKKRTTQSKNVTQNT